MVAHVPTLPDKEQPTIAVVTLLFCEKLAVDSMMDTKTTYIRVKKGEGINKSHVLLCLTYSNNITSYTITWLCLVHGYVIYCRLPKKRNY